MAEIVNQKPAFEATQNAGAGIELEIGIEPSISGPELFESLQKLVGQPSMRPSPIQNWVLE